MFGIGNTHQTINVRYATFMLEDRLTANHFTKSLKELCISGHAEANIENVMRPLQPIFTDTGHHIERLKQSGLTASALTSIFNNSSASIAQNIAPQYRDSIMTIIDEIKQRVALCSLSKASYLPKQVINDFAESMRKSLTNVAKHAQLLAEGDVTQQQRIYNDVTRDKPNINGSNTAINAIADDYSDETESVRYQLLMSVLRAQAGISESRQYQFCQLMHQSSAITAFVAAIKNLVLVQHLIYCEYNPHKQSTPLAQEATDHTNITIDSKTVRAENTMHLIYTDSMTGHKEKVFSFAYRIDIEWLSPYVPPIINDFDIKVTYYDEYLTNAARVIKFLVVEKDRFIRFVNESVFQSEEFIESVTVE